MTISEMADTMTRIKGIESTDIQAYEFHKFLVPFTQEFRDTLVEMPAIVDEIRGRVYEGIADYKRKHQ